MGVRRRKEGEGREAASAGGRRRVVRVVTDNGANCRATVFALSLASYASCHRWTEPYTPRHNGKVECYQCILAGRAALRPHLDL
jgi:hypothetical protein